MRRTLDQCWLAATEVVALAYAVPVEGLRAPSRGRGPRPTKSLREPKKVAIHLTILVSGCDYAELARHIGLHKDTVSSHAAEMRERQDEADAEAMSLALQGAVDARLLLYGRGAMQKRQTQIQRMIKTLEPLKRALRILGAALEQTGVSSDEFIRLLHPTNEDFLSDEFNRPLDPTSVRQPVARPANGVTA